jgi:hypothetical protein
MHAPASSFAPFGFRPLLSASAMWCITVVAILNLAFVSRAAEPIAARSDAEKSGDVRLLIANDDAVATLKQQLGARAITNVDYTKQLQELTKARTAILARYNPVGQRDLIALYNAARADIAQAAADARRKAAIEAQAKQAADREAAKKAAVDAQAKVAAEREAARKAAVAAQAKIAAERDAAQKAAAREVEAKAEAARQALAAQIKAVEDDAQAHTRLALRHDELLFKQSMHKGSAAERDEMTTLAAQAAEIKKKYATSGSAAARSAEFEKRLAELSQQIIQPASRVWAANAFPEPDKVAADFTAATRRAAALIYLSRLIAERVAAPQPDAVRGKILRYQQALERINPVYKDRFAPNAKEVYALAEAADFHLEVVKKYLPVFIGDAQTEVAMAKVRAEAERLAAAEKAFRSRLMIGMAVIALGLFALPLLLVFKGESGPRLKPETIAHEALPLPPALRRIAVFKKDYEVVSETGVLYEKEIWTETNVSTTTTAGSSYVSGGAVYHQPGSTSTHVSTTVFHRYWLRTLDGREIWRRFSDDVFQASKGQIVTTIDWGTGVLLAFNHHTSQLATSANWYAAPHRLRGRRLWFYSLGAWAIAYTALAVILTGTFSSKSSQLWTDTSVGATLMVAFVSAVYVGILKMIVQTIRSGQFARKHIPAFRQFLQESTPELTKRFSNTLTTS